MLCYDELFEYDADFFFQAEVGIRDWSVTGVQTCALPISMVRQSWPAISAVGAPAAASRSTSHSRGVIGLAGDSSAANARSGSRAFMPLATWRMARLMFSGEVSLSTKPVAWAATAWRRSRGQGRVARMSVRQDGVTACRAQTTANPS